MSLTPKVSSEVKTRLSVKIPSLSLPGYQKPQRKSASFSDKQIYLQIKFQHTYNDNSTDLELWQFYNSMEKSYICDEEQTRNFSCPYRFINRDIVAAERRKLHVFIFHLLEKNFPHKLIFIFHFYFCYPKRI